MVQRLKDSLDVRGLPCPLPPLQAKQALVRPAPSQLIGVTVDNTGPCQGFQSSIIRSHHEILAREEHGDSHHWTREGGEGAL